MKKILYLAVLMVIAIPAITSCIRPASSIKSGTVYRYAISQELLDLCDVIVSYRDQDGTIKTDTIADVFQIWEKHVINYSIPFNAYFAYHLKLKPDAQLTKEKYPTYMFYEVRSEWPHDTTRGAKRIISSDYVPRERIATFIDSLNRLGNPIVSFNVEQGRINPVKGNKRDFENFDDLYHYGRTFHKSGDSTAIAEEEPTAQATSAQ